MGIILSVSINMDGNILMKCYKCIHRGSVPGSAYSSCLVLKKAINPTDLFVFEELLASHQAILEVTNSETEEKIPLVNMNPHGVKNGLANWPLDFDPVWINDCISFQDNES